MDKTDIHKTIQDWIFEEIHKMLFEEMMNFAYDMHEGMWGVPCGPTLTMVHPTEIRGITAMGIKGLDVLKGDDEPDPAEEIKAVIEQAKAEMLYPDHSPSTALANYRAGKEIWDTNGDLW
jgi:hypothetical protein